MVGWSDKADVSREKKMMQEYSLLQDQDVIENVIKWKQLYKECSPFYHLKKAQLGMILDDYQMEMHRRGLRL